MSLILPPQLWVPPQKVCTCTTAYVTGDRTASITVSEDGNTLRAPGTAPYSNLVDGDFSQNNTGSTTFKSAFTADGTHFISFLFAVQTKITEVKWYQNTSDTHGTWAWTADQNDGNFTNFGNFTLGGASPQTQTVMSGNTAGYLRYVLFGVSGSANTNPFIEEVEFKQCTC